MCQDIGKRRLWGGWRRLLPDSMLDIISHMHHRLYMDNVVKGPGYKVYFAQIIIMLNHSYVSIPQTMVMSISLECSLNIPMNSFISYSPWTMRGRFWAEMLHFTSRERMASTKDLLNPGIPLVILNVITLAEKRSISYAWLQRQERTKSWYWRKNLLQSHSSTAELKRLQLQATLEKWGGEEELSPDS